MKSRTSCSTSAVVRARAPVSASSQGAMRGSPVSSGSARRPECCNCRQDTPPPASMPAASRVRPGRCASDHTPSCPGKPWPPRCTCAAQVMVSAKPPCARIVSQRYSSSPSVPSAWLCQLVSGASAMRWAQAGPRASCRGSDSLADVLMVSIRMLWSMPGAPRPAGATAPPAGRWRPTVRRLRRSGRRSGPATRSGRAASRAPAGGAGAR